MSRPIAEANRQIDAVRGMPHGPAKIEAAERQARLVDAEGPQEARVFALWVLLEAYHWGGETDRALVVFAKLVRLWDERPELFDATDREMFFWSFKWMVSALGEYPSVGAEQIDRTLQDMTDRYQLAGLGMDAVAFERFEWARQRHAPVVEEYFEQWRLTPRDENSQCEVCEPGDQAAWLIDTGRVDEGVRLIETTLEQGGRCATEPADMLAALAEAYVEQGRGEDAARAHRRAVAELAATESDMAVARGRRIRLAARTGRPDRALQFLLEDQHLLTQADTPLRRLRFLLGVGAATAVLRAQHGDLPVSLRQVPAATVRELDVWVRSEAQALAEAFDARNGNSGWVEQVAQAWATEPAGVELPLDVLSVPVSSAMPVSSVPEVSHAAASGGSTTGVGAQVLADAEAVAAEGDFEAAAARYVEAAVVLDQEGMLADSGFAWAEAAHAAQVLGDDAGASKCYDTSTARLLAADVPGRFVAPVVVAWGRAAAVAGDLAVVAAVAERVEGALGEDLSDRVAWADLSDTRARALATLGQSSEAAGLAERAAEAYGQQSRHADAGHAYWLAGQVRSTLGELDRSVDDLEYAVEAFAQARDFDHRGKVANDLVALLRRTGQGARAEEFVAGLVDGS